MRIMIVLAVMMTILAPSPFLTSGALKDPKVVANRLEFWSGIRSQLEANTGQVALVKAKIVEVDGTPLTFEVRYDTSQRAEARQALQQRCSHLTVAQAFASDACREFAFDDARPEQVVTLADARQQEADGAKLAHETATRLARYLILSLGLLAGAAAALLFALLRRIDVTGDVFQQDPRVGLKRHSWTIVLATVGLVVMVVGLALSAWTINQLVPGLVVAAVAVPVMLMLLVRGKLKAAVRRARQGDPELAAGDAVRAWLATTSTRRARAERELADKRRSAEALRAAGDQKRLPAVMAEIAALESKVQVPDADLASRAKGQAELISTLRSRLQELIRAGASPEAIAGTRDQLTRGRRELASMVEALRAGVSAG